MTWSHMTTAQAVALRELFTQLGTARHRQYWRSAQTHDDDYTCEVFDPTPEEITAIAHLMKLTPHEDAPWPTPPTPGQIAYEAYWQDTKQMLRGHPWDTLPPTEQAHWDAAAQAVLAQCTPQEETHRG